MSGFTEINDAGQLLSSAQATDSQPPETALESISGTLKPVRIGDQYFFDVDLYKIYLTGDKTFSATVTGAGGYGYGGIELFDENGLGVYANTIINDQNSLPAGHQLTPLEPGIYYLGISSSSHYSALSSGGYIFDYVEGLEGLAGPLGPGGGAPLSDWDVPFGDVSDWNGYEPIADPYNIVLTGAEFVEATKGVDLDPLWAEIVDGEFIFDPQTNRYEASGTILLGLKGEPFQPLITVAGSVWYDDQTIHVDGIVSSNIGDVTVPLFNGIFEIDRGEAITSLLNEATQSLPEQFKVAGLDISFDSLAFVNNQIELQGSVQLPEKLGGFEVAVTGDNKLIINNDGVSVTGGKLSLPGERKFTALDLLEVETVDASLEFDFEQNQAKLQGLFKVPTFNDFQLDLTGNKYIAVKDSDNGLEFAMAADFSIAEIPIYEDWKLENVNVKANKPFNGAGSVSGNAQLKTVNDAIGVGLEFQDGKLASIEATTDEGTDFTFLGTEVDVRKLGFQPDINPANADSWEPQFELQGKLTLPESLGSVALEVNDPNKFLLNESGFDLTGGKITFPDVNFNLLGLIDVEAKNLAVEYISQPQDLFRIQGEVSVPTLYNINANFAGDNYIQISETGVDVVGSLSAENIAIVPGLWELEQIGLTIDTTQNSVEGTATLQIPTGIDVSAGIGFQNGEFNYLELGAQDLNKAIGATGAFLQDIAGQVKNVAEAAQDSIVFGGSLGITAGPEINLNLPDWLGGNFSGSLVELNVDGNLDAHHLTATGNINIVGGLIQGNGNAELNWTEGFLKANANFSALGGLITTEASFTANSNLDITMSGSANVTIPDSVPIFGGWEVAEGNALIKYRKDNSSSNNFVAGWGTIDLFFDEIVGGIKVDFDGNWQSIGAEEIASLEKESKLNVANSLLGVEEANSSASDVFFVEPGSEWVLLGVKWSNPANGEVPIEIQAPDGTIFTEADMVNNDYIRVVEELSSPTKKTIAILKPETGNWSIALPDTTNLGDVQFAALKNTLAPTVELTSVNQDVSDSNVIVNYNAFDADSDAQISLFYDTDRDGKDGILITEALTETDGSGNFVWNTEKVATGDYYIYAMVTDENSVPDFNYSLDRVSIIEAGAPKQVDNLQANPIADNQLQLTWSAVENASYYLVSYTADAAGEFYTDTVPTNGAVTEAILSNLIPGETYRFKVEAVDSEGRRSAASIPALGAIASDSTIEPAPGEWNVIAHPGMVYTQAVSANPGDSLTLISAPEGASLNDSGVFSWQVSPEASGWHEVVIHAKNSEGEVDVIRRNLFTDDYVQLAFSNTQFSVKEDGTPVAAVTVTRTGRSKGEVGATLTLSNGTASEADYNNAPISVSFAEGQMSQIIQIPIINDTLAESAETVKLALTNPTGGATIKTENSAVLTIIDNDPVNLIGTRLDDELVGTDFNDTIDGEGGNDYIDGLNGNDLLIGGVGNNDQIFGSNGNDTISDRDGVYKAEGGEGNDKIDITFASTWNNNSSAFDVPNSVGKISGGNGDDDITITMNHKKFSINIKEDADPLNGNDVMKLQGIYGNSVVDLGSGNDSFNGGIGADNISGGNGNDIIAGGDGNDRLSGDAGGDTLTGGFGSDRFVLGYNVATGSLSSTEVASKKHSPISPTSVSSLTGFAQIGTDIITDFTDGQDLIELTGGLSYKQLKIVSIASSPDVKPDSTLIMLASTKESLAILTGVNASKITSADFVSNVSVVEQYLAL
ncbi:Calx-beta domain-containing protein [Aerosakkonema funiforme]|uniref:Calx-beta domain-containing protein n=1 Tax=Aerosakkonema funiforme TaxID=1246630 RepID=UPI0035B6C9A0